MAAPNLFNRMERGREKVKVDKFRFIPFEVMEFDKPRKLMLSHSVLHRFKEEYGKEFGQCLMNGFSPDDISQLLYLSFAEEDDDITLENVEDMLHAGRYPEFGEKIMKLVDRSFPDKPDEPPAKNAKSPDG